MNTVSSITRIILVAEDALGPPTRHLGIEENHSEMRWIEGSAAQRQYIAQLRDAWPDMAERIEAHLFKHDLAENTEVVLFSK